MFKKLTLQLFLAAIALTVNAQTTPTPQTQPFGKIDQADLELKACDFEKEANALVLFNKASMYYDASLNVVVSNHRRVKIFNRNGEDEAKVRIEYGANGYESISGLQAQTINVGADGKPEITRIDKKQIFTERVDKSTNAYIFTFPNIKPGSVIEYKYVKTINSYSLPAWYFQEDIPVRYSELETNIPDLFLYNALINTITPFSQHTTKYESQLIGSSTYSVAKELRGMSNLRSLPDEPYMTSSRDNLQSIRFALISVRPNGSFSSDPINSWAKIGKIVADDEDFGPQIRKSLKDEGEVITKAKSLKTDDDKIAYLFNYVKNAMKWNEVNRWYTNDGTKAAWEKKVGNATEINLILTHLLKQAGVKALPMIVSTRSHGKVNPAYIYLPQFNRAVAYVPIDSTHHYVLDASDKYNTYNETPANILNSYGLSINKDAEKFDLVFINKEVPVNQNIFIQAQISDKGKIDGTAQISCSSYNRIKDIQFFKTDGEKKFIDNLRGGNNMLSLSNLKFENMEVDSLPLMEMMDFKSELTGSDDNYIYLNPNIFTLLSNNPFLSDTRYSDIDFGYKKTYSISGMFKLPAGYKIDAQPKNVSLTMPDNSITFRRIIATQDGELVIRYLLNYNKSIFFKENYPEMHEFHKKMQEMLTEAIVLKKG